jgi:serine/threonine protein kinase/formylglycine-generating enzyme required for sulfatase activity
LQEIVADGDFWKSAAENLSDGEAEGPGLERVVEELQYQSPEDAEEMGEAIELKLSFIDPPTEPGTIGRLKHYDILRVAGRGGMGIVLKAFDRTLRRVVAVKMLAPHLAGNAQARQRFVREGRAAAAICHEHVVTIHAVEESPPFIVMQYVKGETLEARIHRNGSLEVREAIRIAKQIAQGLAAAHTQGVVHRDIKPANILLENGVARVRITDFGLARAVDDASLTQSGVVAGTPQYMAPEQANGDAVDERADLFSLGSVLYTLLAGHAPFRATTTMGVLKRLCDNTARPIREINPEVPEWLVMMINRLHAKRPADRYQSAQEVADVLERGLASLQNGAAAPTIEFATASTTAVADGQTVANPSTETPAAATVMNEDSLADAGVVDFKRLVPKWMFRSLPLWMVFVLVGVCVTPFAPSAMVIAAILAVVWFIASWFVPDHWKAGPETGDGGVQSGTDAAAAMRFNDFIVVRFVRRLFEIAPTSFIGCVVWLAVWLAPAFVWATFFFLQEARMLAGGTPGYLDDVDLQTLGAAFGICACWMLVSVLWFRRRRSDGSPLFTRGSRWRGVLGTLGLAIIFAACGYDTWKSDVYLRAFSELRHHSNTFARFDRSNKAKPLPYSQVKVDFEVAVAGLEVVIDSPDGKAVRLTPREPANYQLTSPPPGTYDWHATLNGQPVTSGTVTFVEAEMAEIKVPRPKLSQLIAGRWESDPSRNAYTGLPSDGEDDDGDIHFEFEFEDGLTTLFSNESGHTDSDQFRIKIDESVTPALIDLSLSDGQQLMGIVKFEAGRRSYLQMHGSPATTPKIPSETNRMMGGGSSMAMVSEPDRLLICITQGSGLRPWEFQTDESRGHSLWVLVRSRESGSLREKLAFQPVKLEMSTDRIQESVRAWAKRLNIDDHGTNSVGMEMVLVPPAAYHLVDQPHLGLLRQPIPEPESIRDAITKDPAFKYKLTSDSKRKIRTTYKFVSYPFVMSRRPVTVDQFRQFIDETGYVTDAEEGTPLPPEEPSNSNAGSPSGFEASTTETETGQEPPSEVQGGWRRENRLFNRVDGLSWQNEKTPAEESEGLPVGVISWRDATEFCKWLSEKEGRQYRLPKNEEWTAAMQLGAARKQLPATNSDEPMINDYFGWFDAKSQHPLGIARTSDTYAEWTQDAQFGSNPDRMVLVHHEVSADGVRFYSGIQFKADKSFRAADVGFRVVAELQALAGEKPADEEIESPAPEVSE